MSLEGLNARDNKVVSSLIASMAQAGSICSQTSKSEMRVALSKLDYLAKNHPKLRRTPENIVQFGSRTGIVTDWGTMKRYLDIAVIKRYASRKDEEYSLTERGIDFLYPPSRAAPSHKKGDARLGRALKFTRAALGTRDPNA